MFNYCPTGSLGINFGDILIKICIVTFIMLHIGMSLTMSHPCWIRMWWFSVKKVPLKMSSAKWLSFYLSINDSNFQIWRRCKMMPATKSLASLTHHLRSRSDEYQGCIQVSNFKGEIPLNISEMGGYLHWKGGIQCKCYKTFCQMWGDLPPTFPKFGGKLLIWGEPPIPHFRYNPGILFQIERIWPSK